jgi:cleavage stimulation factor subunit 3
MSYHWHKSVGKNADAEAVLKAGIKANPTSFALNFAYAEVLEQQKKLAEIHVLYKKLIELLELELEEAEARISSANTSLASDTSITNPNNSSMSMNGANTSMGPPPVPNSMDLNLSQASNGSQGEVVGKNKELQEMKAELSQVWTMYMRFARRAEGLQPARDVFKQARQSRWTPWEVYEASGENMSLSAENAH